MEPTIYNGQTVLVSSMPFFFLKPKIGDIITFKKNDGVFIKRITKVQGKKYFVQGDNILDSIDSRKMGFINKKQIIGKVIYKIPN